MRERKKLSDLRRFLVERESLQATTHDDELLNDVEVLIEGVRSLAGRDHLIDGAIRKILLQPMRQVVEDLEAIEKLGQREGGTHSPLSHLGLLSRWLTTPALRFGKKGVPRRLASWYTSEKIAHETLYELPHSIHGRDFVIWNRTSRATQFRAWSRRLHEPLVAARVPAPSRVVEELKHLLMPPRATLTAPLRLCLAYGQNRTIHPWIYVGRGTSFKWMSNSRRDELIKKDKKRELARTIPQSVLAGTIPLLGPKFGLHVESSSESKLKLTWNGAFLIREVYNL